MEPELPDEMSDDLSSTNNEELNNLRSYIIGKLEIYFEELDKNLNRIVEKEPNDEFYGLAQKEINKI